MDRAKNSETPPLCHSEEHRDEESAVGANRFNGNSRSFAALRMTAKRVARSLLEAGLAASLWPQNHPVNGVRAEARNACNVMIIK